MAFSGEGIVVFQKQSDLQPGYFVAYEAVDWAMETLGLPCSEMAVPIFSKMIAENLIVHASGNPKHPFVCGFYLYNVVSGDGKPHIVGTTSPKRIFS